MRGLIAAIVCALPLVAVSCLAQATPPQSPPVQSQEYPDAQPGAVGAPLRVQTTLVTVPTLVRDKHGAHVWALDAADFSIRDNGVPQRVRLDESPLPPDRAIAIVVEDSDETELLSTSLNGALVDFLNALPDGDIPVTVLTAGARVNVHLPFTSDREQAIRSVRYLTTDRDAGGPQILDGVYRAAELLQAAYPKRQKFILLVSGPHDGDSAAALGAGIERVQGYSKKKRTAWKSAHESEEVLAYVEANNIVVDAIEMQRVKLGMSDYWHDMDRAAISLNLFSLLVHAGDWVRKDVPRHLAEATGGEVLAVGRRGKISGDALHIANDVPALYALSFTPQNPLPGLHRIRVEVPGRAVTVRARNFYWAGGQLPASQPAPGD